MYPILRFLLESVIVVGLSPESQTQRSFLLYVTLPQHSFPFLQSSTGAELYLSAMGHCAFLNRFFWYLPAVWGTKVANFVFTAM
jgi:hypothetical protein